jgi:hypothetical protein
MKPLAPAYECFSVIPGRVENANPESHHRHYNLEIPDQSLRACPE